MTNKNKTTLYIGVTNDLCRRISEHKKHLIKDSFSDKYNLEYCIYYEEFDYFDLAIRREKELKKWNRQKKEDLINKSNPDWIELATEKGFVRKTSSFSQMVNDLMNELKINKEAPSISPNDGATHDEVPPSGRNDKAPYIIGVGGCGAAANPHPSSPNTGPVIPNDSEESAKNKIPPFGRNDNATHEEVPLFGRNDLQLDSLKGIGEGGVSPHAQTPVLNSVQVIPNDSEETFPPRDHVIPNDSEESFPNLNPFIPKESTDIKGGNHE
jgi:putative endonuclease